MSLAKFRPFEGSADYPGGPLRDTTTLDPPGALTIGTLSPTSGAAAGGTAITIPGTNFYRVVGVTIGGVAVTSLVTVSPTSITCVSGAHAAGAVDVVVTQESTVATTKTTGYTYA